MALLTDKEREDFNNVMEEACAKRMKSLMRHRDRYVQAFIAVTGMDPRDCEIMERHSQDGLTVTMQYRPRGEYAPDEAKHLIKALEATIADLHSERDADLAELDVLAFDMRGLEKTWLRERLLEIVKKRKEAGDE